MRWRVRYGLHDTTAKPKRRATSHGGREWANPARTLASVSGRHVTLGTRLCSTSHARPRERTVQPTEACALHMKDVPGFSFAAVALSHSEGLTQSRSAIWLTRR